jgi:dTMP kinase
MHVEKLIRPALEAGKIVISDRFTDSTRAYQGYGHGFDLKTIEALEGLVLGGLAPDLTFILDIDAKAGLERSGRRLAAEAFSLKQKEDRFENLDIMFHERLRAGFLEIAKSAPARCRVIDAVQSVEDIAQQVADAVFARLGRV